MNTAELKAALKQRATIEFNSNKSEWLETKCGSFHTNHNYMMALRHSFKNNTWYYNILTRNIQLFTGNRKSQGVDSEFTFISEVDWIYQNPLNWVELEESKWVEIMTQMLEKKYGDDWKTIELERLVPFTVNDEVYFNFKSNRIYNQHNCIFNQGVLARPKKNNLDITDLLESFKKVSDDIKTSQKELQELKQEISEYKNWIEQVKIKLIKLI